MKEISARASLRLLLFYICFRSLLINTRLVFISYFVSVPLRKGYRGLEYKCSFVRLYLFLFAFLIICIETFGFCRLFCNTCFLVDYESINSTLKIFFRDVLEIEYFYDFTMYVFYVCALMFLFKSIMVVKILWSNTLVCMVML